MLVIQFSEAGTFVTRASSRDRSHTGRLAMTDILLLSILIQNAFLRALSLSNETGVIGTRAEPVQWNTTLQYSKVQYCIVPLCIITV
jgi:hypothetical protein